MAGVISDKNELVDQSLMAYPATIVCRSTPYSPVISPQQVYEFLMYDDFPGSCLQDTDQTLSATTSESDVSAA